MTRTGNWFVNWLTSSTSPVSEKPFAMSSAAFCGDFVEELAGDHLDVGDEGPEAVADELVGDDVAHPAVPLAVAVLEDVGAEDGALAEPVGAVGVVGGAVVVLVVLEDADDVVVAAQHPAPVEPVTEEGAMVAQALVDGEGILAVFGGIELARVDLRS